MEPVISVYEFDEILYQYLPKNTKWLNTIKTDISKGKLKILAKGGMGTVYESVVPDGWVVKKTQLCESPNSKTCKIAQDHTLIYKYTEGDTIITMVPAFIMEIFMGDKLNSLLREKKIFGVPVFKNFVDDFPDALYFETKKYQAKPQDLNLFDEADVALVMIQIISSLILMQRTMAFTHYDLHWENIMYSEINENITLQISDDLKLTFRTKSFPIIIDYGSCVFTSIENGIKEIYINTTNNKSNPRDWILFNEYFDCLTLIKSLQLYLENNNLSTKLPENYIKSFSKDPDNFLDYFYGNDAKLYRPSIDSIRMFDDKLYRPHEVITNLIKFYGNTQTFRNHLSMNANVNAWNILTPPIFPLGVNIDSIPEFPFTVQKKYFMDFDTNNVNKGKYNANIKVLREVENAKIFAFSLFVAQKSIQNVYRYFYDPEYKMIRLDDGKNDDTIFYHRYLANQLDGCINLIKNIEIVPTSEGYGLNQWSDFGVLILIDEPVLNMPMFIQKENSNEYHPWNKITQNIVDLNRSTLSKNLSRQSVSKILNTHKIGTIKEYILWKLSKDLNSKERLRFGVYSYNLDSKFDVPVEIEIKGRKLTVPNIKNTIGNVGSIVRYFVLQDPQFEIVLFRDAHSTLPNRNFKYDRSWYNTWLTVNKRFWFYHGVFYNPEHFYNLKSGFAATWGARKPLEFDSIIKPEEYSHIFGYTNSDNDKFYEEPSYGVDERLLYRLYENPIYMKESYLVGITHMQYLWTGQENPRMFKVLKQFSDSPENHEKGDDTSFKKNKFPQGNLDGLVIYMDFKNPELEKEIIDKGGKVYYVDVNQINTYNYTNVDVFIVEQLTNLSVINALKYMKIMVMNIAQFKDYFFTEKSWLCRPNGFILPSYSFYTDMRCIVFNFIYLIADITGKLPEQVTMREFFSAIDASLKTQLPQDTQTSNNAQIKFALTLQRMIPPRWNIWHYMFQGQYIEDVPILKYIEFTSEGINTKTTCKINRKMWIGNAFKFDKYFFGRDQNIELPENITLPPGYPYISS